jgi:nickel-dependent lactate racemase
MVAALPILKPGGTIILAAEMSEGIGSPDFQRLYADSATPEIFMERILGPDYFVVDQWQLEEFVKVYRHARVVKVFGEGLPAETLRRLHVEPVSSIETAVAESLAEYGPEATIAVIAKGPYVMAEVG